MAKLKWKGGAMLAPVPPALVSCGTLEKPNVCTVAWCGILNSTPPKTYISLRKERYSHEIISKSGEFIINLPTSALVRTVDYCGVKSGRKANKFKECRLTAIAGFETAAPAIDESPLFLECKVSQVIELGSHDMFMADIVAVGVNDDLLDNKGKLRLAKAGLLAYAHGEYFALGKRLGAFGYSVKKKKAPPPNRNSK